MKLRALPELTLERVEGVAILTLNNPERLNPITGAQQSGLRTLLGEKLGAEHAAQWGLIWSCVDDDRLMPEAMSIARRLAELPAHAALETRRVFEAAASNTLPQQLHYEAERQRELLDRPEFAEGVRAFLEKRAPRFAPLQDGSSAASLGWPPFRPTLLRNADGLPLRAGVETPSTPLTGACT